MYHAPPGVLFETCRNTGGFGTQPKNFEGGRLDLTAQCGIATCPLCFGLESSLLGGWPKKSWNDGPSFPNLAPQKSVAISTLKSLDLLF